MNLPPLFGGGKSFRWLLPQNTDYKAPILETNNCKEARLNTHDCIHAVDVVAVPAPNHVGAHHLAACSIADWGTFLASDRSYWV